MFHLIIFITFFRKIIKNFLWQKMPFGISRVASSRKSQTFGSFGLFGGRFTERFFFYLLDFCFNYLTLFLLFLTNNQEFSHIYYSFGKKCHSEYREWRLRGQAQPTQGGASRQRNQSPQVVSSVGGSCITKRYSLLWFCFDFRLFTAHC